jgi:lysozyme
MKISDSGRQFIRKWEGCCLKAYLDTGGVWTIGVGHTKNVHSGQVINEQQVDALLSEDLKEAENCINNAVQLSLSQNQFDALVSFTFNVGCDAFSNSTLLKKLNCRDITGAANEFPRWIYDNGRMITGLLKRRNEEKNMFLTS